jgi:hypothetical protein
MNSEMENVKGSNESKKDVNLVVETKEKIEVTSQGLGVFEKVLSLSKEYSVKDILKALFMTILIVWAGFFTLNPTYIFDKYNERQDEIHAEELAGRFTQSRMVSNDLSIIMHKLHADRAFFIEYHNSVKSLQGAPFAYGSMDFEETNDDVIYIGDEYTNFSLTKYKFVNYLSDNLLFIGTIDEIEGIDKRLYLKLVSSGVQQMALIEVEGTEHPLGILGLTWSKHDVISEHKETIKKEIRSEAVKLALILDNKKNDKR